jgi:hypothetical protein
MYQTKICSVLNFPIQPFFKFILYKLTARKFIMCRCVLRNLNLVCVCEIKWLIKLQASLFRVKKLVCSITP